MKSIVFAILLYFVCASITCNKTGENEPVTTVTNTLTVPSIVGIIDDKILSANKRI